MNINEAMRCGRLYFDGGMGTELIKRGLESGKGSESALFEHPEWVVDIHRAYLASGANIIKTNTFGVNPLKYENYEKYITRAIYLAREAMAEYPEAYLALDIGPLGRMIKPLGDLDFEDAIAAFAKIVRAAANLPVDLILIETMNDAYETKAAVLAAKENSDLPVFVTNVYDGSGKTLTGSSPEVMACLLEGLGVDAIGANCSFGPREMLAVAERLLDATNLPVIINPNAGLPKIRGGETVFDESPESFSDVMVKMAEMGVSVLGGCCGTSPAHISATVEKTSAVPLQKKETKVDGDSLHENEIKAEGDSLRKKETKTRAYVCSSLMRVGVGFEPVLIGERINPTGKPRLKEALRSGNNSLILSEAIKQEECGICALDVNCGLPEIDEIAKISELVGEIQSVISVPLEIDSSNPKALEAAMRRCNGVPLVNSVSGTEKSLSEVLPLVKKYGGVVVALAISEEGIAADIGALERVVSRVCKAAEAYGISRERIVFDPLCLSVSTDENAYKTRIEMVKYLRENGFKSILGVSNISFGMPNRAAINSAFFRMALGAGLSAAIINPYSDEMMEAHREFLEVSGDEKALEDYKKAADAAMRAALADAKAIAEGGIERIGKATAAPKGEKMSLKYALVKGLREEAERAARELLLTRAPMEIINEEIIPALTLVGDGFDKKQIFLPSLLLCAEAAAAAFEVVKTAIPKGEAAAGKILLATVKGDIHDIGKNIVRVVLESWGFEVCDLGRDVPCEKILAALSCGDFDLVGLSALMTTTLPAMKEAVRAIKNAHPNLKVMVGGAVLNREYADMIGADFYGEDAPAAAKIANSVIAEKRAKNLQK